PRVAVPAGLRPRGVPPEANPPLLLRMEWLQVLDAALADVDADVAVHRAVVKEVVPDHVALLAETENEIHDPEVGVELHDVPEDRLSTDLDHRLRSDLGLLREARSKSAAADHRLHARHSERLLEGTLDLFPGVGRVVFIAAMRSRIRLRRASRGLVIGG